MDEKGAWIACPFGKEVVILIGIKEMYVRIPENHISLIVIKSIYVNSKAIPPIIIILGVMIIRSWFHEKMIGHEVIMVSTIGYTNKGICIAWLGHFIKHNNYGLDQP
jgi:hypothetical protein